MCSCSSGTRPWRLLQCTQPECSCAPLYSYFAVSSMVWLSRAAFAAGGPQASLPGACHCVGTVCVWFRQMWCETEISGVKKHSMCMVDAGVALCAIRPCSAAWSSSIKPQGCRSFAQGFTMGIRLTAGPMCSKLVWFGSRFFFLGVCLNACEGQRASFLTRQFCSYCSSVNMALSIR